MEPPQLAETVKSNAKKTAKLALIPISKSAHHAIQIYSCIIRHVFRNVLIAITAAITQFKCAINVQQFARLARDQKPLIALVATQIPSYSLDPV